MDLIKKSTKLLHKRIGTAFGVLACTQNMILKVRNAHLSIHPHDHCILDMASLCPLGMENRSNMRTIQIFFETLYALLELNLKIQMFEFLPHYEQIWWHQFTEKHFSSWFADATVVDSAPQLLRSRSDPLVWLTHMGLGWILIDTLCAQSQSITLWMFLLLRSWILIRQQPYQYSECQESSPGPWCEGRFFELW